jgi:predicted RNA-binding protein with PUA-like domain
MPASERKHWLLKSEPGVFSFEDLLAAKGRTTGWDGVRNYKARNLLRDEVRAGDGVLFYHSNADPPGVAGVARVVRAAYPDPSQFDPRSPYHDAGSPREAPRWVAIDVQAVLRLPRFVPLEELKAAPGLAAMGVVRRGNRLSVQPVSAAEWAEVLGLGGMHGDPLAGDSG